MLSLTRPDNLPPLKINRKRIINILSNKIGKIGIANKNLSNNIFYINLDDNKLLLMYKTSENETILSNYDTIEYGERAESDLLYWFNFKNGNDKNLGYLNKGATVLKPHLITDDYYEFEETGSTISHALLTHVKTTADVHITQCIWVKGKDISYGMPGFELTGWYKFFHFHIPENSDSYCFHINLIGTDAINIDDIAEHDPDKLYFIVVQYDGINRKIHFFRKSEDSMINDYRKYSVNDYNTTIFDGRDWYFYTKKNSGSSHRLYDVKIYDKVLSAEQIDNLFLQGPTPDSELLNLRFKKNDGTDHNLVDAYRGNGDYISLDEAHLLIIDNFPSDSTETNQLLVTEDDNTISKVSTKISELMDIMNPQDITGQKTFNSIALDNPTEVSDTTNKILVVDNQIQKSDTAIGSINNFPILILLASLGTGGLGIGHVWNDFSAITPSNPTHFYHMSWNETHNISYVDDAYVMGDTSLWHSSSGTNYPQFTFQFKIEGVYEIEIITVPFGSREIIPGGEICLELKTNSGDNLAVDEKDNKMYPEWETGDESRSVNKPKSSCKTIFKLKPEHINKDIYLHYSNALDHSNFQIKFMLKIIKLI